MVEPLWHKSVWPHLSGTFKDTIWMQHARNMKITWSYRGFCAIYRVCVTKVSLCIDKEYVMTVKFSILYWDILMDITDMLGGNVPQTKIEHVLCTISKLSALLWKTFWLSELLSKLSEKLKIGSKNLVGLAVIYLLIKTCKILFWSISQEPFGLLKF